MSKLNYDGISEEVAARILEFLNKAVTPGDISGDPEHTDGPVFDDPSTGFGDQVHDYDIGDTVAQRIIDKRTELGGQFTDIKQLDDVSYFGQDKLDDLAYTFSNIPTNSIFNICYNIGNGLPGGINMYLTLTVVSTFEVVTGVARITQATNPPLNIVSMVDGIYSFVGDQVVFTISGIGVGAQAGETNLELTMSLTKDLDDGVATYSFLNVDGVFQTVPNQRVQETPCNARS